MERGGFLEVAGGKGRPGVLQQQQQPPAEQISTGNANLKVSAHFNMASTSLRSGTARTLDPNSSCMPQRNITNSAPSIKKPPLLSTSFF